MKRQIYADHAATTPLDPVALEAMTPFLRDQFANPSQPYAFARAPKRALADAREKIARAINAEPDEIVFTSGATESDNWAIHAEFLDESANCNRDAVVASAFEHHAVLRPLEVARRRGRTTALAHPDRNGIVAPDALETVLQSLARPARVVSVMTANNELGALQPIAALAEVARRYGALFHTDAAQAAGHVPLDVKALDVDLMSASAHKFNGPKGVGFLYIKRGLALAPWASGGGQESGRRAGTENVAGIVGMATALERSVAEMVERNAKLNRMTQTLLARLRESDVEFAVNGAGSDQTLPGLISLALPGFSAEALLHRLDLLGAIVSAGAACDSKRTEISHVLQAIRLDRNLAEWTIRISFGATNPEEDAPELADAIVKIVRSQKENA